MWATRATDEHALQDLARRRRDRAKVEIALGAGLAVGGGVFAYIKLDQYWLKHYASAEVLSVVSLDDGAMLASERIEREKRRRDPNTDQVEYSQELHYRLRRYDQQTGSDQARRLINGAATCVAAGQGRAWCSWETGHAYLLDAKLETVGEADHMPGPPDPLQWHYNGVPAWTADLPEPPDSARLDGETVVLVGRTRSVAIAVADGKERWSTPHSP